MPARSSKKNDGDLNLLALQIVEAATSENEEEKPKKKNPAAVALGRLGGRKGGRARAEKLTEEKRREIATKAARARWDKHKGKS